MRARARPAEMSARASMQAPARRSAPVPLAPALADVARGPARIDRRTKRLLTRLLPGDVAVMTGGYLTTTNAISYPLAYVAVIGGAMLGSLIFCRCCRKITRRFLTSSTFFRRVPTRSFIILT